jgi:hypothetical protein
MSRLGKEELNPSWAGQQGGLDVKPFRKMIHF